MAEEVVEKVGLDQIVDLLARADPHRHREAAVGEMVVEGGVRDEAGHPDDAPARQWLQPRVDRREVRDRVSEFDCFQPREELVAGIALGEGMLALHEQPPHGLILVGIEVAMLRHRPVGRHAGVVATQILEGCAHGVHPLNMGERGW